MASPPAGYFEAVIVMKATAGIRENTFSIGLEDTLIVDPDPNEVAQAVYDDFHDTTAPGATTQIANNWQLLGVRCTKMTESGPVVGEFMATVTGTNAINALPNNTSLLVAKRTASGGRRNRGRMFVPPFRLDEAAVDTIGKIDPATVTTLQTRWDAFRSLLIASGFAPLLFHSKPPYTPTPITQFQVQPLCATQRRRMRK